MVTPEDTLDWWNENDNIFTKRGSRDNGYASGDGRFFLFGWDEGNGDSGRINGTATLRNLDPPITKVIFPIVNGQAKTPEFAAEEMRKTDGAYARIRRVLKDGIVVISIPKEFRYRVPAHSIRAETAEPYYDGFWVCIEASKSC